MEVSIYDGHASGQKIQPYVSDLFQIAIQSP